MSVFLSERLKAFSADRSNLSCLQNICHGIEKEGLRVTPEAQISLQRHPKKLGSALMHPYITTDYSEALLEFITPVYKEASAALSFLKELHQCAISALPDGEFVWNASMPAKINDANAIPVAEYGSSNIGYMKHVYRLGLGHRYGRAMQTIAGIHYNFSLPEKFWQCMQRYSDKKKLPLHSYISEGYFSLIRNFKRYAWMVVYLFGASPAFDKSFLPQGLGAEVNKLHNSFYLPHSTSLRMSDIGYTNQAQSDLDVSYDSLADYVTTLTSAMRTSYPEYDKIGTKIEGKYKQLNTNILQIENEYYSVIRPKRMAKKGETPLVALARHGVEYIEVRCLDINPFLPLGIDETTCHFMDTLLLFCALEECPDAGNRQCDFDTENFNRVVNEGRNPALELFYQNKSVSLQALGQQLVNKMQPIAELLNDVNNTDRYTTALREQTLKFIDSSKTPSSQLLSMMKEKEASFVNVISDISRSQANRLAVESGLDDMRKDYFKSLAKQSLSDQKKVETDESLSFDQFLKAYYK